MSSNFLNSLPHISDNEVLESRSLRQSVSEIDERLDDLLERGGGLSPQEQTTWVSEVVCF